MKTTCHSEFGKIKTVVIKRATNAFVSERLLEAQWRDLHFLEKPDLAQSAKEFDSFETILKTNEATLLYLPRDESVTIDSIYCRDAVITTDHGTILCNMGKASRIHEPEALQRFLEEHQFEVLGRIQAPGTLEGGDCAWINENTLAVGLSSRTNAEGIRQLKRMLTPFNIDVLLVSLPHYKGLQDVFHLMSVFSPVDTDLAVVYPPLMPLDFRNELLRRDFRLIEVPEREFESMGCNVLAIAPRRCVMINENPATKAALEKAGCEVFEYAGREISLKGGGGPTCLTRPIDRYVHE